MGNKNRAKEFGKSFKFCSLVRLLIKDFSVKKGTIYKTDIEDNEEIMREVLRQHSKAPRTAKNER